MAWLLETIDVTLVCGGYLERSPSDTDHCLLYGEVLCRSMSMQEQHRMQVGWILTGCGGLRHETWSPASSTR